MMEHPLCCWRSESWISWWCLHNTCGSGKMSESSGKMMLGLQKFWDFKNEHQTEKLCNLCYRKYEFGTLRRWLESVPAPKSQHVTVRQKKKHQHAFRSVQYLFDSIWLWKLAIPPSILAIECHFSWEWGVSDLPPLCPWKITAAEKRRLGIVVAGLVRMTLPVKRLNKLLSLCWLYRKLCGWNMFLYSFYGITWYHIYFNQTNGCDIILYPNTCPSIFSCLNNRCSVHHMCDLDPLS